MPTVIFDRTFQAAHRLTKYDGKCGRIHGHNFHITAEITTDYGDEHGFAIDFSDFKDLIDVCDHRLILHEDDEYGTALPEDWLVLVPEDPSTEFLVGWFARRIANLVMDRNENATAVHVKAVLVETEGISARAEVRR